MFNGGDIIEISVKHPTLGSFTFFPKAAEDFTLDPGGFTNSDDQNMIAGNGGVIRQKNRKVWSMEGILAWDMEVEHDISKIQDLADSTLEADWIFTHINGTVYGGKGAPVGDNQGNTNTAQLPIKVNGGGRLLPL